MVRVAVRLPPATGRMGDYLADVLALEAAGADSVWLDAAAAESTEPWIILGAVAAVTHRVRLGLKVGADAGWPAAVDTLGRLSGGRVVVGMRPRPQTKTFNSSSAARPILLICDSYGEAQRSALLADGVIVSGTEDEVRALRSTGGDFELWVDSSVPSDKAGWVRLIAAMESGGATGIIVPWDPRLIDLLRSAGEPDDRTDLLIATG
jgi:hypothetical protein